MKLSFLATLRNADFWIWLNSLGQETITVECFTAFDNFNSFKTDSKNKTVAGPSLITPSLTGLITLTGSCSLPKSLKAK